MASAVDIVAKGAEGVVDLGSKSLGFILSSVFKGAQEVREISKRTKANKHQSAQLNERIQILVGFLKGRNFDDAIDQPMKLALAYFVIFLQKCVKFMKEFSDASFAKRVWNNRTYRDQFSDLHTEFSQYAVDLNVGAALVAKLANGKQDQEDQQLDLNDMQQLLKIQDIEDNKRNFSSETTEQITNDKNSKCGNQKENIFVTGIWKYRRHIDETFPDLPYLELIFDTKKEILRGFGEDYFGRFRLTGTLNKHTQTIEMNWLYENEKLNADHRQHISLKWDKNRDIFRNTTVLDQKPTNQTDLSMEYFEMALFTPLLEN